MSMGCQVLIKWVGLSDCDNTWEDNEAIDKEFPDLHLVDKGNSWGEY